MLAVVAALILLDMGVAVAKHDDLTSSADDSEEISTEESSSSSEDLGSENFSEENSSSDSLSDYSSEDNSSLTPREPSTGQSVEERMDQMLPPGFIEQFNSLDSATKAQACEQLESYLDSQAGSVSPSQLEELRDYVRGKLCS